MFNEKICKWKRVTNINGPGPKARHGHRAVTKDSSIIIMGGGNNEIFKDIHVYDTVSNNWFVPMVRGDIPPGSACFGMVTDGTRIITFGGMEEYGIYSNTLYELHMPTWTWKKIKAKPPPGLDVPSPRLGHSFTLINGKIYMFGGLLQKNHHSVRFFDDLYTLSIDKSPYKWDLPTTFGVSPCKRESHSAVHYKSKSNEKNYLIIFGGMNGKRLGDLWILDVDSLMWSSPKLIGIPPIPRSLHTSTLIDGKMYIFGGWTESDENDTDSRWVCTNTLNFLDIENLQWGSVNCEDGSWPKARAGHCAVELKNRLYSWSGKDGCKKVDKLHLCFKEMWYLDVEKPAAPRRIQSIKCDVNSFELKWDSVVNASLYMLQTCKIESEENNMLLNAPGIYEKEELSLLVEPKVEEEQPICLKVESTTPIVKFEAKSERMEEKVDAPSPPKPQLSIEKQEQEKEQAIVQLNAMAKSDLEITNQTRNLKMELDQKFQQKSTLTVLQTPPNMGKINITCSNSNSKPQVETKVNSPEVFRFDENSNDLISYSPEHNGSSDETLPSSTSQQAKTPSYQEQFTTFFVGKASPVKTEPVLLKTDSNIVPEYVLQQAGASVIQRTQSVLLKPVQTTIVQKSAPPKPPARPPIQKTLPATQKIISQPAARTSTTPQNSQSLFQKPVQTTAVPTATKVVSQTSTIPTPKFTTRPATARVVSSVPTNFSLIKKVPSTHQMKTVPIEQTRKDPDIEIVGEYVKPYAPQNFAVRLTGPNILKRPNIIPPVGNSNPRSSIPQKASVLKNPQTGMVNNPNMILPVGPRPSIQQRSPVFQNVQTVRVTSNPNMTQPVGNSNPHSTVSQRVQAFQNVQTVKQVNGKPNVIPSARSSNIQASIPQRAQVIQKAQNVRSVPVILPSNNEIPARRLMTEEEANQRNILVGRKVTIQIPANVSGPRFSLDQKANMATNVTISQTPCPKYIQIPRHMFKVSQTSPTSQKPEALPNIEQLDGAFDLDDEKNSPDHDNEVSSTSTVSATENETTNPENSPKPKLMEETKAINILTNLMTFDDFFSETSLSKPLSREENAPPEEKLKSETVDEANEKWHTVGFYKNAYHQSVGDYVDYKDWAFDSVLDLNSENIPNFTSCPRITFESGQTYKFRVCALNLLGCSGFSEPSTFKTVVGGLPGSPRCVKISKDSLFAHLSWQPPERDGANILEYAVYMAIKPRNPNATLDQLYFVRAYTGPKNECKIGETFLKEAFLVPAGTKKQACVFRISAKNAKGYGPVVQVKWIQDESFQPKPAHAAEKRLNEDRLNFSVSNKKMKA